MAYILVIILRKCLHDYPAGLADLASLFNQRNAWARCFDILSVQAWAEPGHGISDIMPWLADAAVAPADCIQDALADWLKRYSAHAAQGWDALIADYGNGMSEPAQQAARG